MVVEPNNKLTEFRTPVSVHEVKRPSFGASTQNQHSGQAACDAVPIGSKT